jgi:hypothetical protein
MNNIDTLTRMYGREIAHSYKMAQSAIQWRHKYHCALILGFIGAYGAFIIGYIIGTHH